MSKKKIVLFVSIIMLIACVLVIVHNRTYYYIAQANKNLDAGEIKLLAKGEDLKDTLEKEFTKHPGFGGSFYSNEREGINITFSGFPDVTTAPYSLTRIELKNPKYSFYDLHVGDPIDKADATLKENGFKKLVGEGKYQGLYKKDKILLDLFLNDKNEIEQINIDLQSTNKHKVVF